MFNLKFEYAPNAEISFSKLYILLHIFSTVFIAAYFMRSHSISSVKKSKGSTNISSILGQKKSFDIITQTKVRFKDVAGLDESKIEVQ